VLILVTSVHFLDTSHLDVVIAGAFCTSTCVCDGLKSDQVVLVVSTGFSSAVISIVFRENIFKVSLVPVIIHLKRAILYVKSILLLLVERTYWNVVCCFPMTMRCFS
jgi:hypothetical protein